MKNNKIILIIFLCIIAIGIFCIIYFRAIDEKIFSGQEERDENIAELDISSEEELDITEILSGTGLYQEGDIIILNSNCYYIEENNQYVKGKMPIELYKLWKTVESEYMNGYSYYQWENHLIFLSDDRESKFTHYNVSTNEKQDVIFSNAIWVHHNKFMADGRMYIVESIKTDKNESKERMWFYDFEKKEKGIILEGSINQYVVSGSGQLYVFATIQGNDTINYITGEGAVTIKEWEKDAWIELLAGNEEGVFFIKESFKDSDYILYQLTKEGKEFVLAGISGTQESNQEVMLGKRWFTDKALIWNNPEQNSISIYQISNGLLEFVEEYTWNTDSQEKCNEVICRNGIVYSYWIDNNGDNLRVRIYILEI